MTRSAQHLNNVQSAHDMLAALGAQCRDALSPKDAAQAQSAALDAANWAAGKIAGAILRKAMGDTVGTAPSVDASGSIRNAGAGAVTGPNLMPPVAPKPMSDAEDAKLIQHAHDTLTALGATCATEKAAGGRLNKNGAPDALAAMRQARSAPFYGHRPGTR